MATPRLHDLRDRSLAGVYFAGASGYASFCISARAAKPAPTKISAKVASKLSGATQLMHEVTISTFMKDSRPLGCFAHSPVRSTFRQ